MTLYKARVETRNFLFEAYGATEKEARSALYGGLDIHGVQYRVAASYIHDLKIDTEVHALEIGKCYRDREALS